MNNTASSQAGLASFALLATRAPIVETLVETSTLAEDAITSVPLAADLQAA